MTRALAGRDLAVRYPGASRPALDGVDVCVGPGELVAVVGENGSGKSTLCLALAGALSLDGGVVTLDGRAIDGPEPAAIQPIQQTVEDQVVAPVVRDDVAFGPECLGLAPDEVAARVQAALDEAGLAGFEGREVETLSGGELARLALAGALALRPRYLIVDEATAHLDAVSADRFVARLRALADGGTGVLLVSHRPEEARYADRVLVLHKGRVAACGQPRALLYDEPQLRACGLAPPPIVALVRAWREAGRLIEGAPLTAEELAEAACASLP